MSEAEQHLHSEFDAIIIASACALLGRTAQGVTWLRTSVERGNINYPYMNEHSDLLSGLRTAPGFATLMQEVKPRWESVVAWEREVGA